MFDTSMNDLAPLDLPRFRKALRPYAADLPIETYRRYARGHLPKMVRFIIAHPELIEAMARDAKDQVAQPEQTRKRASTADDV